MVFSKEPYPTGLEIDARLRQASGREGSSFLKKEPKNFCYLGRSLDPARALMGKSFLFF